MVGSRKVVGLSKVTIQLGLTRLRGVRAFQGAYTVPQTTVSVIEPSQICIARILPSKMRATS